jgi:hypothetical protein
MIRVLLVAACIAGVFACNGNKARPNPPGGNGDDGGTAVATVDPAEAAKCDALKDKVAGLYQKELAEPVEGEVDDNTHMILTDCRANPNKLVPCIEGATSVAQLERDCVIPLDDEGTVEAKQFLEHR